MWSCVEGLHAPVLRSMRVLLGGQGELKRCELGLVLDEELIAEGFGLLLGSHRDVLDGLGEVLECGEQSGDGRKHLVEHGEHGRLLGGWVRTRYMAGRP